MMWRSVLRLTSILVVSFGLGVGVMFWIALSQPATSTSETITVTIEEGEGPRLIATKLQQANLLVAERPFFVYVLLTGQRNQFYPGVYELRRNMNIKDIVATLTNPQSRETTVRVLEGWRITDIAKEVAKKTKVTEAEFLAAAPAGVYEGYLFPDTYSFDPEATATDIVAKMRANFERRTQGLTLTKEDVILASIVEREAQVDADRPMVAGVYLNRLKIGMALQADPTVQYGKGSWDPITVADYRNVVSPYNTYLNNGLPPTPISNPGLKSLQAVKNPTDHDYYFFIHTSDGSTYYARTGEEHNENKRKYLR